MRRWRTGRFSLLTQIWAVRTVTVPLLRSTVCDWCLKLRWLSNGQPGTAGATAPYSTLRYINGGLHSFASASGAYETLIAVRERETSTARRLSQLQAFQGHHVLSMDFIRY